MLRGAFAKGFAQRNRFTFVVEHRAAWRPTAAITGTTPYVGPTGTTWRLINKGAA
jgi:hypothetical protein